MKFEFDPTHRAIYVRAVAHTLGSEAIPLSLLLDTGASRTTIRTETLVKMGAEKVENSSGRVTMAEGHAIAEEYRLQSFESLGTAVVPFDVFGMNLSHGIYADGVLGWDFLANLKMTIDFVYGTIRILKPTKPRTRRK